MGLDVGTMRVHWDVEPPTGAAYEFALTLREGASLHSALTGEGRCLAGFSQRRMLLLLDEFERERGLSAAERREVWDWVASLPWAGWREALDPPPADPSEYGERHVGGRVELYFAW